MAFSARGAAAFLMGFLALKLLRRMAGHTKLRLLRDYQVREDGVMRIMAGQTLPLGHRLVEVAFLEKRFVTSLTEILLGGR